MKLLRRMFPRRDLTGLRVAREIADRDLQAAVLSRDTQRISAAQAAMTRATHAFMRAEQEMRRG